MPPSQCVIERQYNRLCGSDSIVRVLSSPKILAPVVVNPLIVSNHASTNDSSAISINGIAPKIDAASHENVTIPKPSRKRTSFVLLRTRIPRPPSTTGISPACTNFRAIDMSSLNNAIGAAVRITSPTTTEIAETTRMTTAIFIPSRPSA